MQQTNAIEMKNLKRRWVELYFVYWLTQIDFTFIYLTENPMKRKNAIAGAL